MFKALGLFYTTLTNDYLQPPSTGHKPDLSQFGGMVVWDHLQAVEGVDADPDLWAADHDAAVRARVDVVVLAQKLLAMLLLQRQVGSILAL